MTRSLTFDKRIIAALGVFFFMSPNLNVLKFILYVCGLESDELCRNISLGIFCILDIIIGIYYLKVRSTIKEWAILVIFNVLYALPLLLNRSYTELMQYAVFILPVTIITVIMVKDREIMQNFIKYLIYVSRAMIPLAALYILMQYIGTNRDGAGIVIIQNMSYGDIAYIFLPCFIISVIDFLINRKIIGIFGALMFLIAIMYSGSRSAILCAVFACLLILVLMISKKAFDHSYLKKAFYAIIIVVIILALSLFVLPSGSRLKMIDINFSGFSISDLLFETKNIDSYDTVVIHVPTNSERNISDIYEEEIVKRDNTKAETEKALHEDVSENRNEIIRIKTEDDRAFAENYKIKTPRTFLWRTALKEFQKHPVTGNGPCYYKIKYDGDFPHNIILETMSDFGIIGLIVLLFLGIYCFVRGVRYYRLSGDIFVFSIIILLFAHIPRYLLYTTLYSNMTIAMTILFFMTIGKLGAKGEAESTNNSFIQQKSQGKV